ncbi:endonuclease G, mitochondrial [Bathymodiolus japonicus methanotrophic gill symbiont]|uniref:DNA/RNA non-specific endonuclease n=1 Tax=Bathymodiolus japonicus methanotrophic gill symbiont TaxID=113269 RepID=UPI001B4F02F8|nr:DNA/RNA non-specific endonuclease [Bathymodiolus japonicus methanotrophic gill symbiont]GFO72618.1 endonuclease G, mitochondrial [Bathymodiolus japonicus methanotrophic gill symbiont]
MLSKRLLYTLLLTLPVSSYSHTGGLNKEGCHTNKKTATYHCHQQKKSTKRSEPNKPTQSALSKSELSSPALIEQVDDHRQDLMKLDYEGFTIWLDCQKRGAVKFRYNAQRDTGNFKRSSRFYLDPNVPKECQQYSAKTYKAKDQRYDRGHLVPANHLDYSKSAIKGSNTMTNILPQAANMNRGAWLMTEEITECYRDIADLLIIGGVIWGNNPDDDYFVKSHGVKTPSAFWKVIIRGTGSNERAIAWIVPNSQEATRKKSDAYIVSIKEIERVTGEMVPVADFTKYDKSNPWVIPRGCNKG